MPLLIFAIIIFVLGIAVPEIWKRKRAEKLKQKIAELERKLATGNSDKIGLELALLRLELTLIARDIRSTTWQAEATFGAILIAVISLVL